MYFEEANFFPLSCCTVINRSLKVFSLFLLYSLFFICMSTNDPDFRKHNSLVQGCDFSCLGKQTGRLDPGQGWAFGTVVQVWLGILASHSGVPSFMSSPCFKFQLLASVRYEKQQVMAAQINLVPCLSCVNPALSSQLPVSAWISSGCGAN